MKIQTQLVKSKRTHYTRVLARRSIRETSTDTQDRVCGLNVYPKKPSVGGGGGSIVASASSTRARENDFGKHVVSGRTK